MVLRCWLIFHSVSLFFLDYSTVDHVITIIITSVMYCIVLYCFVLIVPSSPPVPRMARGTIIILYCTRYLFSLVE